MNKKKQKNPQRSPEEQFKDAREISRREALIAITKLIGIAAGTAVAGAALPKKALAAFTEPIILDDGSTLGSFVRYGPPYWWSRSDPSFQNGQMWFTYNTDTPGLGKVNHAIWTTPSLSAGKYDVYVYIPNQFAETRGALYQIKSAAPNLTPVEIDQVANRGKWVGLGTFTYQEGQAGYVYLDDVVPEQVFKSTKIAYDAIVWVPEGVAWNPGEGNLVRYDPKWAQLGAQAHAARRGDPVSTATGSFFYKHTDLTVPGRGMAVEFIRSYNSVDPRKGVFGLGWSFNYDVTAIDRGNGEVIITYGDGRAGLYVPNGSGFTRPPGFNAELTELNGKLVLDEPNGIRYTFRSNGALESITDPNGNHIDFAYTDTTITLTDTVGRSYVMEVNADGYITKITDPVGRVHQYEYSGDQLTAYIRPDGNAIRYEYTGNYLSKITDPDGRVFLTNTYDAEGRVISQQDGSGSTTTFEYQDSPRVTKVTDNEGKQTTYEYDSEYRLTQEGDALGYIAVYTYDANNNLTARTDRRGNTTTYSYDDRGNLLEQRDPLGGLTTYTYNHRSSLLREHDAAGSETTYEYDATGVNAIRITDAENGVSEMTYDAHGQPLKLTNPAAQVVEYSYTPYGIVASIRDPKGNISHFEYDGVGRRTATIDAKGRITRIEYDVLDRVTVLLDAKGRALTFTYDNVGNLLTVTDRRGFTTYHEYDANSNLVLLRDARNFTTHFTYDREYHRRTVKNPRGYVTEFQYDPVYNLSKIINAKGQITTMEYDADRNLVKVIDTLGQVTNYDYDALNRLIRITDPLAGVTEFSYDAVGRVTSQRAPNTALTSYFYDRMGRLLRLVDALSNATVFEYDPVGNLRRKVDALGNATTYTYSASNKLVDLTSPLGHRTQWEYDEVQNLVKLTDARGNSTTFAYDENDNLIQVTDALNGVISYAYDAEDQQISVKDQNGHERLFEYDEEGNLLTVTLPLGQATRFAYDETDNRVAITNAKAKTTHFKFDPLDQLTDITNPLGHNTNYQYDAIQRPTVVTDANGNATVYGHDPLDRLAIVTDAEGFTNRYGYDAIGSLTSHIDPNNHETRYEVDLLGRVVKEINAIGSTWSYEYDAVGQMIRRVDANGETTDFTYDADGRLNRIQYPSGAGVNFEYDPVGNLVRMVDDSGEEVFAYDVLNRLTETRRASGLLQGNRVGYQYDAVGNRTLTIYPDDKSVRYQYDANDWLSTVTDGMGRDTTYAHDAIGLPTAILYPNNTVTKIIYDDADRLTSMLNETRLGSQNTLISSHEYTMDNVGNRTRVIEKVLRGQVITWDKAYRYDKLYRLLGAVETPNHPSLVPLTSEFAYDPAGNMLRQITNIAEKPGTKALKPARTIDFEHDPANRLLRTGTRRFSYDANGNRKTMADASAAADFRYDAQNRMIGAQTFKVNPQGRRSNDATLSFVYDGLGRRRQRHIEDAGQKGKTQSFLYDMLGYDLIAEYAQPSHPITTYYYRDQAQVLSRHEIQGAGEGLQYFHHYDALGNTTAWTNHVGTAQHGYRYAPFGQIIDNNRAMDASVQAEPHNPLTWSGKPFDPKLETYHFGARDYDPRSNNWTTADSYRGRINEPMTLHRYHYTANNPITLTDAYGFDMGPRYRYLGTNAKYWYDPVTRQCRVPGPGPYYPSYPPYCYAPYSPRRRVTVQGGRRTEWWENALDAYGNTWGYMEPFVTTPGDELVGVAGYFRANGTYVKPYSRVLPGARVLKGATNAIVIASVLASPIEQLWEDRNRRDLDETERFARASVNLAGTALLAAGTVALTGALVTAGAPVLAVAAVGIGAGLAANWLWNDAGGGGLKSAFFKGLGID